MEQAFLAADDALTLRATISGTVQLESALAITVENNIVRHEKGGQPQDRGTVTIRGRTFPIGQVFCASGRAWIVLEGSAGLELDCEDVTDIEIDRPLRLAFAKSHTLCHLLTTASAKVLEDFVIKSTSIDASGTCVSIVFQTSSKLDSLALNMIDCVTRHLVNRNATIRTWSGLTLADCKDRFPRWRSGGDAIHVERFDVVEIDGIDATPCDGSHVSRTGEVGPYRLRHDLERDGRNVRLTAERTSTWMYWFGEEALLDFDWDALHHRRIP